MSGISSVSSNIEVSVVFTDTPEKCERLSLPFFSEAGDFIVFTRGELPWYVLGGSSMWLGIAGVEGAEFDTSGDRRCN